jgi:8-oxo-dGTP pyrophosphatase MutT (NUDIX family)
MSANAARPFSFTQIPQFDPRQIPVVGVDAHLPPVPAHTLQAAALRQRFARPPAWEPEAREEPRFSDRSPAPAAVLVALVMHPEPTLILTERTSGLSTHSGQIAFAGGKVDAQDASAAAAALREAHEEVGLDAAHCEVLGELPQYITGTAFHITPVVALVRPGFSLTPNPSEVADVFEVPLAFLMNPANHRRHAIEWAGAQRQWWSMPYDDAQAQRERFIWGATAGMLRNLYRFLSAA